MLIRTSKELGHLVRDYRRARKMTQAKLSALVGASRKWVIDLESGKRTTDLSLVLRTLNVLGIELEAVDRSKRHVPGDFDIDAIVDAAQRTRR